MKITRLIACLLTAAVFALAAPAAAGAARFAVVKNTQQLNVRAAPGASAPLLGRVPRGGWVEVLDRQAGWVQGRVVGKTLTGWLSAGFLEEAPAASSTAVVHNPGAAQYLNLRQFPSYSAPVLGTFRNGAVCTVLSGSDGWYYVEISGLRGYFRGEFLRFGGGGGGEQAEVYSKNGGKVNLRSGPAYSYPAVAQFAPGTRALVGLKGNLFWQVSVGSLQGFMDSNFLRLPGTGSGPGTLFNAYVTPVGASLNLREQPSTGSRVLGSYPGNTRVLVREQGSLWCRVRVLADGREGYMMTSYLTLEYLPAVPAKQVRHPDGTFVYLRSAPVVAAGNVLARVPHNTLVAVVAPAGSWTRVSYAGLTGYMMNVYLK